jgi:outer membrane protein OmpA-like peptidoglycan-associated protein
VNMYFSQPIRTLLGAAALVAVSMGLSAPQARAQGAWTYDSAGDPYWTEGILIDSEIARQRTVLAERYVPTIWVDPDGCQHWVMDDGFEGFMTPHVTRDGRPVCNRGNACGVVNTDQLFANNRYNISSAGRSSLQAFFQSTSAQAFIIEGHTDSRASDEHNMRLSHRRASAVAEVARSVGARVVAVRGYGERNPRASNGSTSGMAENRRVEISCIR